MSVLLDSSKAIVKWLEFATDNTSEGKRVKERYKMNKNEWGSWYRPDCNIETSLAFLKAWEYTKENKYLTLAREIFNSIVKLQNTNGSFPFAHTGDTNIYTNDNSEVPIFLFRMAEIDTEYANEYRKIALKGMDFILSIQNSDGSWRVVNNDLHTPAMFTAHSISGLAHAYKFTTKKEEYLTAIEKGLNFIEGQILENGRIRTCYEVNNGTEYWRPPSSDQAICIRALAQAEFFVANSNEKNKWKINRLKMIDWMDKLISQSGAVRNGLGEGINGADIYGLTDHVYTTAFAIEAYLYSYFVDKKQEYLDVAERIVGFSANNLYYSDKNETNGVIRGAYNLEDNNWDTSDLILNGGQEGGADMVYTGWVNAPLVCHFYDFEKIISADMPVMGMYYNTKILYFNLERVIPNESYIGIYTKGKKYYIPIVNISDEQASDIHICIHNRIKALKK